MIVLPAIDLYGGRAVRLLQGDYEKSTVYGEDPPALAAEFERAGAEWLHLVDLDGAKHGTRANFATVESIVKNCKLRVELGGGIRDRDTLKAYLDIGVERLILGTAAVKDPEFLSAALDSFGEAVAVGVDVRDGMVAVKGWTEQSEETLEGFCAKLEKLGLKTVICTDISRDGMMKGSNLALYKSLKESYGMDFIASGGVSSLKEIRALAQMGMYGAILGKALYTGKVDLREAIAIGGGA